MVALKSMLLSILLMFSGNERSEDLSLSASTPADIPIRKTLKINPDIVVDFIRWQLHMKDSNFELSLNYGESQPNTLGFKPNSITVNIKGQYSIAYNPAFKADVLTLKSAQLGTDLLLLKITNNIYQILESNSTLMNGNGGWSYTLNNNNPQENGLSSLTFPQNDFTANQVTYDGRTPCKEFTSEYKIAVHSDCFKLKWRLVLNFDPVTHKPTTYSLQGISGKAYDTSGKWTIIRGTTKNRNAIISKLNPDEEDHSISFLRANGNILFFLDKKYDLFIGNKDFSYTLNQKIN